MGLMALQHGAGAYYGKGAYGMGAYGTGAYGIGLWLLPSHSHGPYSTVPYGMVLKAEKPTIDQLLPWVLDVRGYG